MTLSAAKLAGPLPAALATSSPPLGTAFGSKDARTAANDAAGEARSADRDPLWIIPIGMACFFAAAAAVTALG